jgi:hypothetical protein
VGGRVAAGSAAAARHHGLSGGEVLVLQAFQNVPERSRAFQSVPEQRRVATYLSSGGGGGGGELAWNWGTAGRSGWCVSFTEHVFWTSSPWRDRKRGIRH